jgi:hypothetical protein
MRPLVSGPGGRKEMAMRNKPNYMIVDRGDRHITIRDMGPWGVFPTVTNGAEDVVTDLVFRGELKNGRKLLYYDSENRLEQLFHWNGSFKGFGRATDEPYKGDKEV